LVDSNGPIPNLAHALQPEERAALDRMMKRSKTTQKAAGRFGRPRPMPAAAVLDGTLTVGSFTFPEPSLLAVEALEAIPERDDMSGLYQIGAMLYVLINGRDKAILLEILDGKLDDHRDGIRDIMAGIAARDVPLITEQIGQALSSMAPDTNGGPEGNADAAQ
jgi:hypothetical protein